MLGRLIRKEILEHLMSLRFAIACLLCLLVVLCSLFVRGADYRDVLDDYREEKAMEKSRLDTMDRIWSMLDNGMTIYREPNPLKIMVRGIQDENDYAIKVNQGSLYPMNATLQNASTPLFLSIDMVAFVGLIMSLMALVFGYDAVCGEKERGTLRLALSYSVPRHLVLVSKWIGGYVTLIAPFLMTFLIGAIIVMVQGKAASFSLTESQWLRLAGVGALALLYIGVMYALAICVSCLTSKAATSIMLLLSLWVVFVLAVPNLSPYLAQALRPTDTVEVLERKTREVTKQADDKYDATMKEWRKAHGLPEDRWWDAINWSDPKSMEIAYQMWVFEWPNRKIRAQTAMEARNKITAEYDRQVDGQMELTSWLARLSPFSCFAMSSAELADAGIHEGRRFTDQAGQFQGTFINYACDECLSMEKKYHENKDKSPGPWAKVRDNPPPPFYYVPAANADYAHNVAIDAGIMAGMMAVLLLLSYTAFVRYDVR